jgi:ornithine decarboxylase
MVKWVVENVAETFIRSQGLTDSFALIDLDAVSEIHALWTQLLPKVHPFYAVKCNDDDKIIAHLANLGCGFDCASPYELAKVSGLAGAAPVIYAHPCKPIAHLQYAKEAGVEWTTFDTPCELKKIANIYPTIKTLLRVRADDDSAAICLGNKYGATMEEVEGLLETAKSLGIDIIGVSFHVGSGSQNPNAYYTAIQQARKVFGRASSYGFEMSVLDIGGGFTPNGFGRTAEIINIALDDFFDSEIVKVIAEPGRLFVEACGTLMCSVHGVRSRGGIMYYWISDGVYGNLNNIMYDNSTPTFTVLGSKKSSITTKATIFGPTCDGHDIVLKEVDCPVLEVGDWLLFPNMGAYTRVGACNFNGFSAVDIPRFHIFHSVSAEERSMKVEDESHSIQTK